MKTGQRRAVEDKKTLSLHLVPLLSWFVCVHVCLCVLVFVQWRNFLKILLHTPAGNHTPACNDPVKSHYLREWLSSRQIGLWNDLQIVNTN